MKRLGLLFPAILAAICLGICVPVSSHAQTANYSHARIVRLSRVDGEVQVARGGNNFEPGVLSMPIEQGFTVATNQGRAEIEFESGTTAWLAEGTELQFTELALQDGARITRLALTQGLATFYTNLAKQDAFMVSANGGVKANLNGVAVFRVESFSDGSTVGVLKGDVEVDSSAGAHRVAQGSTLSYRTSDPDEVTIGKSAPPDDWDRWVAHTQENVPTYSDLREQYSSQYSGSPIYGSGVYPYNPGYSYYGYGYLANPYAVGAAGLGFCNGFYGFSASSFEPWGWVPGGGSWLFSPTLGCVWPAPFVFFPHPHHFEFFRERPFFPGRRGLGFTGVARPFATAGVAAFGTAGASAFASAGAVPTVNPALRGAIGSVVFDPVEHRWVNVPNPNMTVGAGATPASGSMTLWRDPHARSTTTPSQRVSPPSAPQRAGPPPQARPASPPRPMSSPSFSRPAGSGSPHAATGGGSAAHGSAGGGAHGGGH